MHLEQARYDGEQQALPKDQRVHRKFFEEDIEMHLRAMNRVGRAGVIDPAMPGQKPS